MKGRIIVLVAVLAACVPAPCSGQGPRGGEQPRRPVVVNVSEGGFRWGDAAVGAAAASGAALALAGIRMFRLQLRKEEG